MILNWLANVNVAMVNLLLLFVGKPCKAHTGIQQLCAISLLFDPIISEYGERLSFSTLLLPCDFETDKRESHDH